MNALLALSKAIDWLTDRFGTLAEWAVLLSCAISAGNAAIRYAFNASSNGWLEIQWYLFAVCVMFGAAQVLRVNEHVRVDVVYGGRRARTKVLIDLFGLVFFLLPVMAAMLWTALPLFLKMLASGETSSNAGGLIRWPAMLTLPVGFALVLLQGVSEVIKRVAWLAGRIEMSTHYERPLQ